MQLVEACCPLVVAGDQLGQFLGDLLSNRLVLGGLPVEADSGANRVWVRGAMVEEAADEVPA